MAAADRMVQLGALEASLAMLNRYPDQFTNSVGPLQKKIATFIQEDDLHRASLALQCAQLIIRINRQLPENAEVIKNSVTFAASTLIQGQKVVDNLQELFLVACQNKLIPDATINQLIANVTLNSRTSAKMAAIGITSDKNAFDTYMKKLFDVIGKKAAEDEIVRAILTIGEIGTYRDLSGVK